MITSTPPVSSSRASSEDVMAPPLRGPERMDGLILLGIGLMGTLLTYVRIDWIAFFLLFWMIDIVGYWPGVIAARLTGQRRVPPPFVYLYNLTHSTAGGLGIGLTYCLLAPETAPSALAIAIHLGIDRGILANRLKRAGELF